MALEARRDGVRTPQDNATTYVRWSTGDGEGKFNTFQSEGFIDVAKIEKPYDGRAWITPVENEKHLMIHMKEPSQYILTIEVAAENSAPVTQRYLFHVEPFGQKAGRDSLGGWIDRDLPDIVFKRFE